MAAKFNYLMFSPTTQKYGIWESDNPQMLPTLQEFMPGFELVRCCDTKEEADAERRRLRRLQYPAR